MYSNPTEFILSYLTTGKECTIPQSWDHLVHCGLEVRHSNMLKEKLIHDKPFCGGIVTRVASTWPRPVTASIAVTELSKQASL